MKTPYPARTISINADAAKHLRYLSGLRAAEFAEPVAIEIPTLPPDQEPSFIAFQCLYCGVPFRQFETLVKHFLRVRGIDNA